MREKAGVGVGLAAILAVGAGLYVQNGKPPGGTSGQGGSTPAPHIHTKSPTKNNGYVGGCTAYQPPRSEDEEKQAKDDEEKGISPDEVRSDAYKVIETFVEQGEAEPVIEEVRNKANVPDKLQSQLKLSLRNGLNYGDDLNYMVALVPDPQHTHLSLFFDRSIEAIEGAAEDEDFSYDSSWMPWKVQGKDYALRGDETTEEERVDQREACPGVLLFRKAVKLTDSDPSAPYKKGLVVFVVGEQPTRGLNVEQWENAIRWMQSYAAPGQSLNKDKKTISKPFRILGPTFSGTLPSLEERMQALPVTPSVKSPTAQPPPIATSGVVVASGNVSGAFSIQWFNKHRPKHLPVRFLTFAENQEVNVQRLLQFMGPAAAAKVAIISEDETAYGKVDESMAPNAGKDLLNLYYPRDISGLRSAYQQEQLFSHAAGSPSEGREAVHTALSDDLSEGSGKQGDTVPNYSKQSNMGEESELYGIVSELRSRHIQDLILNCTNPLDCLFLTRFFHHTYPEGRVIVIGSDLLFRREVDTTEFRGTLALTNYSLIPRSQAWTSTASKNHIFQSSDEEGTYLAGRSLLNLPPDYDFPKPPEKPREIDWPQDKPISELPDFDHAGWLHENVSGLGAPSPDTWLTVVGRDGYWPIAVLHDETLAETSKWAPTIASLRGCNEPPASSAMWQQFNSVRVPWAICAMLSLGLAVLHLCGCVDFNLLRFAGLDEAFRRRTGKGEWWWWCLFGLNGAGSVLPLWCLLVPWVGFELWYPAWSVSVVWWVGVFVFAALCFVIFSQYLWGTESAQIPLCYRLWGALTFLTVGVLMAASLWAALLLGLDDTDKAPFFYRATHFTTGVTPLLPLWILMVGFYVWGLHSLKGNGLLTTGKPLLPAALNPSDKTRFGADRTRISAKMSEMIEEAGIFLHQPVNSYFPALICAIIWGTGYTIKLQLPIRTFERGVFDWVFNLLVLGAILLAITDATRLISIWLQLKRMLSSLARSPLRRTFRALRDISVRSLWDLSANVPRSQYQFFWRQMDAVGTMKLRVRFSLRVRFIFRKAEATSEVVESLNQMDDCGKAFRTRYLSQLDRSAHWWEPVFYNGKECQIREVVSKCMASLFFHHLEDQWTEELPERTQQSLESVRPGKEGEISDEFPLSKNHFTCAAEEFVCLAYISYIQNALGRIRNLVFSMSTIFVAVALAIASYPVNPKPAITTEMLFLLVAFAIAVAFVYAGMERDTILSDVTNTQQVLSWEFYRKYIFFLVPPVLALLSAQFPELADSIFGWIQPDFAAVK